VVSVASRVHTRGTPRAPTGVLSQCAKRESDAAVIEHTCLAAPLMQAGSTPGPPLVTSVMGVQPSVEDCDAVTQIVGATQREESLTAADSAGANCLPSPRSKACCDSGSVSRASRHRRACQRGAACVRCRLIQDGPLGLLRIEMRN
jgi:hypothetical protein